MFQKIDHIGYAVRDMNAAIEHYAQSCGYTVSSREILKEKNIELAFLNTGETKIELLAGVADPNPISTFIEKHGEGMHHVCYEVGDIVTELARLKALGMTLIDEKPRPGAHGTIIAFIHPKNFFGVLTEPCQYL